MSRGLVKDGDVKGAVDNLEKTRIYPYSQRQNPGQNRFIPSSGKAVYTIAPPGFDYWERLSAIINSEPVTRRPRDHGHVGSARH